MAKILEMNKVVIDNNGCADLFIKTNLSEDGQYNWFYRVCLDKDYITGWDHTDEGFMLNFDLSLECDRESFDSDREYQDYMVSAIKELIPVKYKVKELANI